jgi:hypothetical protein
MSELKERWKNWWYVASVHNKEIIDDPTTEVIGMNLPRTIWRKLNRIRTGQGCCAFLLHRWNVIESPLCECGQIQTMEHLVKDCPIHKFHLGISDVHKVTN